MHWTKRVAFKDLTIIKMPKNWILNNKMVFVVVGLFPLNELKYDDFF